MDFRITEQRNLIGQKYFKISKIILALFKQISLWEDETLKIETFELNYMNAIELHNFALNRLKLFIAKDSAKYKIITHLLI